MEDLEASAQKKPDFRSMAADYRIMFSRSERRFHLGGFAILIVQLLIYVIGPRIVVQPLHVQNALALINAIFFFTWAGMFVFALLSPILARVILPLVIVAIEIVRLLLLVAQYCVDQLLIRATTECFLYPKRENEA